MAAKKASKKKSSVKKATSKGASKSDFIREKLKAGLSAADIVKAGTEAKIAIAPSFIYKLKSKLSGGGGKKTSKGKPGRKKKGGKGSASDFVRKYPSKSANEIAALAKKAGIKMSVGLVYTTRAYDKKKGGSSKTKGKPGPKSRTPRFQVFPGGGGGGSESDLKKAALAVGFPRALKVVEDLGKKFESVQRQYQALLG